MFEFLSKLGFKGQKTPGAAEPSSFWKGYFWQCVRCARKFGARGVRAGVVFFRGFRVPMKNGLAAAVRRVFPSFSVFFWTPFSQTSRGPLPIPLFLFGCFFSFVRILLGIGGNAALHICFWAVGLQPFLSSGGFWGLLRKTLFFPLKKGYLGSFLSVSFLCLPFVRPWLLSLLFVTLSLYIFSSLSLSLSFFFLVFFSSLLSCLYFYLPCLFVVFSCLVASLMFHEKNNFTILHLKVCFSSFILLIFLFRVSNMFLSLFFSFFSLCVCWWTSMFPIIPSFGFTHCERLSFSLGPILIGEILVDVHETL